MMHSHSKQLRFYLIHAHHRTAVPLGQIQQSGRHLAHMMRPLPYIVRFRAEHAGHRIDHHKSHVVPIAHQARQVRPDASPQRRRIAQMVQQHAAGKRMIVHATAELRAHRLDQFEQAAGGKRTLRADVDGGAAETAQIDGQLHHQRQLHAQLGFAGSGAAGQFGEAAHRQAVAREPIEGGTAERDASPLGRIGGKTGGGWTNAIRG